MQFSFDSLIFKNRQGGFLLLGCAFGLASWPWVGSYLFLFFGLFFFGGLKDDFFFLIFFPKRRFLEMVWIFFPKILLDWAWLFFFLAQGQHWAIFGVLFLLLVFVLGFFLLLFWGVEGIFRFFGGLFFFRHSSWKFLICFWGANFLLQTFLSLAFGQFFSHQTWLEKSALFPFTGFWVRNFGSIQAEFFLSLSLFGFFSSALANRWKILGLGAFLFFSFAFNVGEEKLLTHSQNKGVNLHFLPNFSNPPYFLRPSAEKSPQNIAFPSLFLLPESAYPNFLEDSPRYKKILEQELSRGEFLAIGSQKRELSPKGFLVYNAIFFLEGGTYQQQVVKKKYLLPFGEFIPTFFSPYFDRLIFGQKPIYSAGEQKEIFFAGYHLAIGICFEGLLPLWYQTSGSYGDQIDFLLLFSREYLFPPWVQKKINQNVQLQMLATGKPWAKITGGGQNLVQNLNQPLWQSSFEWEAEQKIHLAQITPFSKKLWQLLF